MDNQADKGAAEVPRWYTLIEAAVATGLTTEALRKRIKRERLRGTRGNDGTWRVWLSPEQAARIKTGQPDGREPDSAGSVGREPDTAAIKVLEIALAALRERAERAETLADSSRIEAGRERERADRERDRADAFHADAKAERARASAEAVARQASEARTGQAEQRLAEREARLAEVTAAARRIEVIAEGLKTDLDRATETLVAARGVAERADNRAVELQDDLATARSQITELVMKLADVDAQATAAREAAEARAGQAERTAEALREELVAERTSWIERAWRALRGG